MSNSFIWPIDRTLLSATIPVQSEPDSNGNEGVLHIPSRSRTDASTSDCLVAYPGYSLAGGYFSSAEMQYRLINGWYSPKTYRLNTL